MNPLDFLTAGTSILNKVLDFIPDPAARLQAQQKMQDEMLTFANQQMAAQAQVNDDEAKSADKFTSRARPFLLYICGFGLAYSFVLSPFITAIVRLWKPAYVPVVLDSGTLLDLVTAMLGLGGMHAYQQVQTAKVAATVPGK